jgi:anti-sigma factor RsiW
MALTDKDREDLVAYLDGELDRAAARKMEARLNVDARIRAEATALRRTWELLDFLPRAEPSVQFTHRTLERLAAQTAAMNQPRTGWRRWSPWAVGLGWAAAVLLAAAAGYAGVRYLAAGPDPEQNPPQVVDKRPPDDLLVENLRVVENRRLYENVDDLDYLRALDDPDLFGEVDVD